MKRIHCILTVCLWTACSAFSQNIWNNDTTYFSSGPEIKITDTLYQITAVQLRATCRIFVKHSFLQQENRLLTDRVTLLQRSAMAKDDIIQSQQEQIAMLNTIAVKHRALANNLKAQIEAERRKRTKYVMIGGGIGAVAMGVLIYFQKRQH